VALSAGCASKRAPAPANATPSGAREEAVERVEICVGSTLVSAGELPEALYYDTAPQADGTLAVGYYVRFSDERPWANNWLTWSLLPALAVDLVYSRALFVAPGLQALLYGPGDVEGFRIVYAREPNGSLSAREAVADDGQHAPVALSAADLHRLDPARPTLYTTVWSHQLGGTGVRSAEDLVMRRCYGQGRLTPLTARVARELRLEGRAPMAHVERLRTP
jgi:hypothetical protein